jgi:hypothetical protein
VGKLYIFTICNCNVAETQISEVEVRLAPLLNPVIMVTVGNTCMLVTIVSRPTVTIGSTVTVVEVKLF